MRTDSIGTVLQQNHYYPYGMLMGESSDVVAANRAGGWHDGAANPFRFSGNEMLTLRDMHLGDYHARIYDYATGRFLQPDPLREQCMPLTSYLYCAANPVNLIDPNGLKIIIPSTVNENNFNVVISMLQNLTDDKLTTDITNASMIAADNQKMSDSRKGGGADAWRPF